ncbi:MAG: pilus assembly protein TadG-related protein [Desulfobacterota bacterium]|nr:pilus assembly protein TadG-related protein [Thermodesulfobacteriota bacterium]
MVTFLLLILLSFISLGIDLGNLYVVRNELQNIADASALAAARGLGHIYEEMSYEDQQKYNAISDEATIKQVAKEVAVKNQAGGKNISLNNNDIIIGQWNAKTRTFSPTLNQPDAVRVIARRDDVANGPVTTFFAKILGKDTIGVSAKATAALTGQSSAGEGELPIPAAISRGRFTSGFCDGAIKFYPTGSSCAGWHTYTESPSSASKLSKILKDLKKRTFQSPPVQVGQTAFNFTGGTLASVFQEMKDLFDAMKGLNDGVLDHDKNPNTWTTTVAVYDLNDCSNPNGKITIIGFSEVTISEVILAPEKEIRAKIKCNFVTKDSRGGGEYFGTKGSIPGLVE